MPVLEEGYDDEDSIQKNEIDVGRLRNKIWRTPVKEKTNNPDWRKRELPEKEMESHGEVMHVGKVMKGMHANLHFDAFHQKNLEDEDDIEELGYGE